MATRRARRKTIFFPPKNRRLADIISIESPTAFRRSIRTLAADGVDAHAKRALVLAQNRARAMLEKRRLSDKERRELRQIASTPLPPVTKRAKASSRRRRRGARATGPGLDRSARGR